MAMEEDLLPLALTDDHRTPSYSSSHQHQHLLPEEWEVEYSRFFDFPPRSSLPPLGLKPLPRSKCLPGGTWITASSLTLLRLCRPRAAPSVPVLTVSVPGLFYEEHFLSSLHISLPRLSCASQCSGGGSRAIFLSFRDCSNQVQKFALRFSTYCEVQRFLDYVKETSQDITETGAHHFACENPGSSLTGSPIMMCNENPPYLRDKEPNVGKSASALTINDMAAESCQPQLLSNASTAVSPALPLSFTEFLLNCSGNGQEEQSKQPVNLTCNPELNLLESLANGIFHSHSGYRSLAKLKLELTRRLIDAASVSEMINKLADPISEMAVNAEIMKYASNASFQDMLTKIEGVIEELGDDMSL